MLCVDPKNKLELVLDREVLRGGRWMPEADCDVTGAHNWPDIHLLPEVALPVYACGRMKDVAVFHGAVDVDSNCLQLTLGSHIEMHGL